MWEFLFALATLETPRHAWNKRESDKTLDGAAHKDIYVDLRSHVAGNVHDACGSAQAQGLEPKWIRIILLLV